MIVDRYYYQQLSQAEKIIYKTIYKGVMAHQDYIPLPVKGTLPQESLERIYHALTDDNPLIYFLNQSLFSYATDQFGNIALCPQYFWDYDKVREYNRKIEQAISAIARDINLLQGSDYEKVKKVHDWMCQNVSYDFDGTDMSNPHQVIYSHNIIGVFAAKKAQCEGIAKAVKVLLNAVDIKCIVASGEATDKGNVSLHAWNVVKLDDTPYHLDVTWDIGHKGRSRDRVPYDYFNVNDTLIGKTHRASSALPRCTSMAENYFTKNKLAFRSRGRLLAYVKRMIAGGQTEIYFRYEGRTKISVIADEVNDYILELLRENKVPASGTTKIVDDEMGICWFMVR